MPPSTRPLDPRQLAVLDALCRRMVPLPPAPHPDGARLAARVADRVLTLPPADARKLAALLSLFAARGTGLVCAGAPCGYAELDARRQEAWLRRWETSRIPLLRNAFHAVRRLVLATYYADPEVVRALGWPGPYDPGRPAAPWQGPWKATEAGTAPAARPPLDLLPGAAGGVTQGADIRGDLRLTADVCVVGSGPGGAVAAARLAEAGFEVVVLEEGGYWRPEDFVPRTEEAFARLYADGGARATADAAIPILQGRSVGGSATVNWLAMLRTPEWVLEEWAAAHGTEGMGPVEMAAVYDRIERETHARMVPDDAHSRANRLLLDGARRLGWSARPVAVNAAGCVRAGECGLGCRHGARRSAGEVYVPRALAHGARVFADVRVERIERAERGGAAAIKRVVGTVLDRETGEARGSLAVEAPVVVVAGGAVGTPVLLQRSGMGGGGVGRYLRLHPTTVVGGIHAEAVLAGTGLPITSVVDEFLRGEGGYGFCIETPPVYPAMAAGSISGFGAEHRGWMERLTRMLPLIVIARDGADDRAGYGTVTAAADGRPRIRYAVTAADRRRVLQGVEAAVRLQFAAGAEEVATGHSPLRTLRPTHDVRQVARWACGPGQLSLVSAHVNGTCRIGRDPGTSGCTPDGERHGFPGVYVTDGSLFPTGLGVNPQETVMAVATLVAERIAARHPAGRAGSAGTISAPGR